MMNLSKILDKYIHPLKSTIESVIIGQKPVIKRVVMSLFAVGQRDFHTDGSRHLGCGHLLAEGPTGTGKCFAKGTPILMFDGSIRAIEDVKVGDLLMGPDSKSRKVISLGHGFDEMYKVTPVKGDPYTVNSEHILSLKMTKGIPSAGKICNITVKDYLKKSKTFRHCAKGYRVPVDFPDKEVPLDPYYIGLWLGDGTSRKAEISNIDKEVIDYVGVCAKRSNMHLSIREYKKKCPLLAIVNKPFKRSNEYLDCLRNLGLINNKHIPDIYKINSEEIRLQVLAGLIDSDGSLSCNGYDFVNKNKRLAKDVLFLVRSLGFAAYMRRCKKKCQTGVAGYYWRIFISGDCSRIPLKILRKNASVRKQKKDVLVTGIKVKAIGYGEYFGFELEGPDRLFLLGDFTVVHNSVLCKVLSFLLAGNNKRVSGMPDSLPSDITGCEVILLNGDTKTVQGPLFCNILLADEINRFNSKSQTAFIEAFAEGTISIGNVTYKLQKPFFCIATQNPSEQKGTSRLQEALSDRFMFKVIMKETSEDEKVEIAKKTHSFNLSTLKQIVSTEELCEIREYLFDNTYVSDYTRRYCAHLINAINHPSDFGLFKDELDMVGADPIFKQRPCLNDRTMLQLEGASMMAAVMDGRDYVTPQDVYSVAADVFRVRLIVFDSSLHLLLSTNKYQTETQLVDCLINEALNKV